MRRLELLVSKCTYRNANREQFFLFPFQIWEAARQLWMWISPICKGINGGWRRCLHIYGSQNNFKRVTPSLAHKPQQTQKGVTLVRIGNATVSKHRPIQQLSIPCLTLTIRLWAQQEYILLSSGNSNSSWTSLQLPVGQRVTHSWLEDHVGVGFYLPALSCILVMHHSEVSGGEKSEASTVWLA